MTLIVEDGSNVAGAESYASVAFADTYFSNRGNLVWAALATPAKEVALRKGFDYLGQVYRNVWQGVRVNIRANNYAVQPADWPRAGVYVDDTTYIGVNVIPIEVQRANVELALKSTVQDLLPDQSRLAIREKVGPLEVEYAPYGTSLISYAAVANMLAPYLGSGGSGQLSMVRC